MNGLALPGQNASGPLGLSLNGALGAAQSGADDARRAAERFVPEAARFLTSCVYGTGFAVAYGVVLPVTVVSRILPKRNPVVYGLADGARAAVELARETRSSR